MATVKRVNQLKDLQDLIASGGDMSIAVAYLTKSGLRPVKADLELALRNGKNIRLLIDLNSGTTEPSTLRELLELSANGSSNFNLRAFFGSGGAGIFHGKVFISHHEKGITFISGSYNLTGAALFRNLEHGLIVECGLDDDVGKQTLNEFEKEIWVHKNSYVLDKECVDHYEKFRSELRKPSGNNQNIRRLRTALAEVLAQHTNSEQKYWLFKCNISRPFMDNPRTKYFSFEDLKNAPGQTDFWGFNVKGNAARRCIDNGYIKLGDGVLFYHSGITTPKIVGTATVVKETYDHTEEGGDTWPVVDIRVTKELSSPVTLQQLRDDPDLGDLDWGSRNCILRVPSKRHWDKVLNLGQ